jgi:hypothetical protein
LSDHNLENPHVLVENDEWTLEKFSEMVEDTYTDLNANDKVDLEDYYGLAPASDSETAWYFACGASFLSKSEDSELTYTYLDDANTFILDDVIALYDSENVLKFQDTYDSNKAFREGRALFHSTALCDITMLNDMADEYGIVPMPKYDEYQKELYSNANRYISTMAVIPSSVTDIDNVGLLVEALAMASQYTSLDKQYDTVLLLRQALDEKSKMNLQLVAESVSYDWGYTFDIAGLRTKISQAILKGNVGVADDYASVRDMFNDALSELIARFYYEHTEE